MANFTETLELLLRADASQGISEIRGFANATEKSIGQAESSIKRLSAGALKLGGSGMALGGFLTAMADKDIQSMKGLEAAISVTGHTVDEYQDRIDNAIASQAKFGHTDGEVTESLNTLTGAYGDADKALDRMQLVADLAAKKHISLAAAAEIVAKVHGGSTKVLKEFNVQVGTNADGTKDYEGALDQLSGKLQGQASASVSGFTGWLKVQGAQIENIVSSLGEKYGPAILGVSTGLTALSGIIQFATGIQKAHTAAVEADTAAEGLSKTAMLAAASAGIALAGALIYGEQTSKKLSVNIAAMTNQELDKNFDKIAAAVNLAGDGMDAYVRSLPIEQAVRLADSLDRQGKSSEHVRGIIALMTQAEQDNKAATDSLNVATSTYADTLKALDEQIHGAIDPVFGYEKALIANRKAQQDATDAMNDGKHSADEIQTANINAAESALAVKDAADKLSVAIQNGSVKLDEVNGYLAQFVAQGILTQAQADQIAASINSIPGEKTVSVYADTGQAEAALARVSASLGRIIGGVFGLGSIGLRAAGGPVSANAPYIVGEQGPELFVPSGSGSIVPNNRLGASGSSSGNQGQGNTYYIDARGAQMGVGQQIVDAIHKHARSNPAPPLLKEWLAS